MRSTSRWKSKRPQSSPSSCTTWRGCCRGRSGASRIPAHALPRSELEIMRLLVRRPGLSVNEAASRVAAGAGERLDGAAGARGARVARAPARSRRRPHRPASSDGGGAHAPRRPGARVGPSRSRRRWRRCRRPTRSGRSPRPDRCARSRRSSVARRRRRLSGPATDAADRALRYGRVRLRVRVWIVVVTVMACAFVAPARALAVGWGINMDGLVDPGSRPAFTYQSDPYFTELLGGSSCADATSNAICYARIYVPWDAVNDGKGSFSAGTCQKSPAGPGRRPPCTPTRSPPRRAPSASVTCWSRSTSSLNTSKDDIWPTDSEYECGLQRPRASRARGHPVGDIQRTRLRLRPGLDPGRRPELRGIATASGWRPRTSACSAARR